MDFIVGELVRAKWTFAATGEPISVLPRDEVPQFYKGKPVQRSLPVAIGTGMITSTDMKRTSYWGGSVEEQYEYEVTFTDGNREWLPQDCLTAIVPKTEEEEEK
tara:strand:+ start:26666 stop:26977 length:312 start_codon:yes stop_codon:yes gene_type:complete